MIFPKRQPSKGVFGIRPNVLDPLTIYFIGFCGLLSSGIPVGEFNVALAFERNIYADNRTRRAGISNTLFKLRYSELCTKPKQSKNAYP